MNLIERLREIGDAVTHDATICSIPQRKTMYDAADEIERLTAERDDLLGARELNRMAVKNALAERAAQEKAANDYAQRNAYWIGKCDELRAERDALAAQVVAMREALQFYASPETQSDWDQDHGQTAKETLAIDTAAAEAILREREAKVLETAAAHMGIKYLSPTECEAALRRMVAERRNGK